MLGLFSSSWKLIDGRMWISDAANLQARSPRSASQGRDSIAGLPRGDLEETGTRGLGNNWRIKAPVQRRQIQKYASITVPTVPRDYGCNSGQDKGNTGEHIEEQGNVYLSDDGS